VTEAVIVSTARTAIGKAYRGAFNNTSMPTLASHAIEAALYRADVRGQDVEELIMGCGRPEGTQGKNIARHVAIRAGLPSSVAALTVSRHCSSGLQAIASAAHHIIVDGAGVIIAAGGESISLVQNEHTNEYFGRDDWLEKHNPKLFMPMLETAEVVAKRTDMRCKVSCGRPPPKMQAFSMTRSSRFPPSSELPIENLEIATSRRFLSARMNVTVPALTSKAWLL
jgi:acetyl-CoA C-acetyltransferase